MERTISLWCSFGDGVLDKISGIFAVDSDTLCQLLAILDGDRVWISVHVGLCRDLAMVDL